MNFSFFFFILNAFYKIVNLFIYTLKLYKNIIIHFCFFYKRVYFLYKELKNFV